MGKLRTRKNFHNFKFKKKHFFSKKWSDKKLRARQIMYDGPIYPDTFFILDESSMALYVYFDAFGTKEDPRIIRIGKVPVGYIDAIQYISGAEVVILNLISSTPWKELREMMELKCELA